MGTKKGRPRKDRDDMAIKVSRPIATQLKAVAMYRGVPLAQIASELLEAPAAKAYVQMLKEAEQKGEKSVG